MGRRAVLQDGPGRRPVGGPVRSMVGSPGSTVVVQASRKSPSVPRFRTTTWTGPFGSGKRSDSWKVRCSFFASSVVSHSPQRLANPRE